MKLRRRASDEAAVDRRGFIRRIVWGAKWGLVVGLCLVPLAVILRVFGGAEAFERSGMTFTKTLVVYFVGGGVSGAIVGLLLPLTRRKVGAAIVGVVASAPIATALARFNADYVQWTVEDTAFTAIFAVAFGAATGIGYFEIFRRGKYDRVLRPPEERKGD